ncbi:MAG: primosomal protein N' [Candidatus Melainabacteria bacterium]|nr:primosomal protein N' [Candidatus Melainabacteria bacterium]
MVETELGLQSVNPQTRLYSQILLDIQVQDLKDRLFTYRVPESLHDEVFVGAQVLVPFGSQMVAGYVISLLTDFDEERESFKVKEILEVVDPLPLFDESYIDFLAFIAAKYCASMQDVVSAAVPSCLVSKVKRHVRLVDRTLSGAEILLSPAAYLVFTLLQGSAKGILSLSALRRRFESEGKRRKPKLTVQDFLQSMRHLSRLGYITIDEVEENGSSMKTELWLRASGLPPRTAKQKQVLAAFQVNESSGLAENPDANLNTSPDAYSDAKSDASLLTSLNTSSNANLDTALSLAQLLQKSGVSRATIDKMVKEGMLESFEKEVVRDALGRLPGALVDNYIALPELTEEQKTVYGILLPALEECFSLKDQPQKFYEPWLLHGVTGSGKTEIYLRLIARCLELGRTALFLVPEIALTPQLSGRLKARFGALVAVWHSGISAGERYDAWRRLRSGEVRVLLGARSAILANIPDLGLIVLDEEHDGSYKQSTPAPRYNARDLAVEKARRCGALVLFGSATPDLASFERARQNDRILSMKNRVHQPVMPRVEIVDMRQGKGAMLAGSEIFSRRLADALKDRLEKGEQSVLLINRRGYASHIFCQACGTPQTCRNCSVSLVLHSNLRHKVNLEEAADQSLFSAGGYLACHHCGYRQPLKEECSSCQGPFLKIAGVGTQKVEKEVSKFLPDARIVRLDSDVVRRKGAFEEVLARFTEGQADILIGTQMVAKGLDIAKVTLVGVLLADSAFNLPDYRSSERGFQLLTQVAGRAGRGETPGSVILQTYTPELPVLNLASRHDYAGFFAPEIESRRYLDYPPFARLTRVLLSGEDEMLVQSVSEIVAEEISYLMEDEADEDELKILGPAPCLIERIKGRYRYHLIIKNKGGERLQRLLVDYLRGRRFGPAVSLAVDVDAIDLI